MAINSLSVFLPSHRGRDLNSHFRSRLDHDETDQSAVGFYDRSTRTWKPQTQREFLRRAAMYALQLSASGVQSGQGVLLACTSPEATLVGFFGAIFIGAIPAVLPIRPAFDNSEVINQKIESTLALLGNNAVVVVEDRNGKPVVATNGHKLLLDVSVIHPLHGSGKLPEVQSSSISHIQLTSGSTGVGKGVAVTHSNVFDNIASLSERAAITPYDIYVSWLPLYHDMGLISQALMTFTLGIDVYFMSPFDFLADPVLWVRTMSEKHGTVTASPTFGYELVAKKITNEQLATLDLSTWKSAYCGAEPISADATRAFYERFASCGLRPEAFTPSYGLAEATLAVSGIRTNESWRSLRVTRDSIGRLEKIDVTSNRDNSIEVVSLGKVVDGLEISLVDLDGAPIKDELTCGEIIVNGTSVAAGWITEGGAITPFGDDGLHTGDIGFFEDGELFVVDRIKNIIIRHGHNYSAQVLEQTVADITGVDVSNVLVFDRDIANGSGLTAIIEIGKKADPNTYVAAIKKSLDAFTPPLESAVLVKAGSLPRTTSGKKRHIAVREALNSNTLNNVLIEERLTAEDRLKQEAVIDLTDHHSFPFTIETEESEAILQVVSRNLRSRGLDIPVLMSSRFQHDLDFDSLGLLELAMQAEEAFSVELEQSAVSKLKTVHDLSVIIQQAKQQDRNSGGGLSAALSKLKSQVPQYFTVIDDVRPNREILVDGRWMTDFSSCSYMGLEEYPEMLQAVNGAHDKWGLQRWSTRAVGLARPVIEAEQRLASLIGVPDTMAFATITLLHIGVLPLLAGPDGAIIIDSAAHTSMQEAAALARGKGSAVSSFKHGNLDDLELHLKKMSGKTRRIIVVDGVYSMSGAALDVRSYQDLAKRYDATLYIDDAHGFGVLGEDPSEQSPFGHRGNGIVRNQGCDYENIIYVAGLGKAYSTSMGFVSCPTPEYRNLFHTASTTIFGHLASTASLAQAQVALDINDREGDAIRSRLHETTKRLIDGVKDLGFTVRSDQSTVVNVIVGDVESLILATNVLWDDNIKITPAMFPAVPLHEGGLRFTVTATNTHEQVDKVLASLSRLRDQLDNTDALAQVGEGNLERHVTQ